MATTLAEHLNSYFGVKFFKPSWHENLGWHPSANSKNIHVWECRAGEFCCLIGEEGCGCGIWKSGWKSGEGSNPITAIRRALDSAAVSVAHYLNILNGAANQIGHIIKPKIESFK